MKRFWKSVTVEAGAIHLDGRPVRTPGRLQLVLPAPALAEAVADEWRAVGEEVDPRLMPLTGLSNAAIERAPEAGSIAAYAETDLLCYRADTPPDLVVRQAARWDPPLAWARARYDLAFVVTTGIVHVPQSRVTLDRLAGVVEAMGQFERTGLSQLVTIGGSLVVGMMVQQGALEPDEAFDIAHLDELWQAEHWGEEWMATETRTARRRDFDAAARFLKLL